MLSEPFGTLSERLANGMIVANVLWMAVYLQVHGVANHDQQLPSQSWQSALLYLGAVQPPSGERGVRSACGAAFPVGSFGILGSVAWRDGAGSCAESPERVTAVVEADGR
eukprot:Skav220206  [mRNA]  locus=scaffold2858:136081:144917:+ [translate_table: standard]